jgi:acetone carboxylase beta subunit
MARLVLSLPLVAMDSVGAGAGSFVRLDPYSKSIKLGPDSAGYRVGTCWPESGLDTVSVSDCHVVLGYLNPDNFLGGAIKLDVQRARDHIKAQIADPLGLSVEDAAAGVIELLDLTLSEYLRANISAKGYNPAEFTCFSYGGAGPVHTYGYTEGVGFKDVVVPAWAPASRPSAAPAPTSSTATTSRWIWASPSSPATPRRPQPAPPCRPPGKSWRSRSSTSSSSTASSPKT